MTSLANMANAFEESPRSSFGHDKWNRGRPLLNASRQQLNHRVKPVAEVAKTFDDSRRGPKLRASSATRTFQCADYQALTLAGASGVALNGYDPVAFFTDAKPVNGDFKITTTHHGATYYFANKSHKNLFLSEPEKYAPQNGGFCTFGVSVGALFPVDINTWQVYNDRLYLNLNPDILEMFKKNMDGNIAKAAKNWPSLVEKNAS